MPEVRGRRPAPRAHWPALVVVLFSLAAALALNGYVTGELADAGYVRPRGPSAQVPPSIATSGPSSARTPGGETAAIPPRTVALTFDDGPDPTWTPQSSTPGRHDVQATFFVLGSQVLRHPDLVRRELAEGHEIGNHSFTHPDLTPPRGSSGGSSRRPSSPWSASRAGRRRCCARRTRSPPTRSTTATGSWSRTRTTTATSPCSRTSTPATGSAPASTRSCGTPRRRTARVRSSCCTTPAATARRPSPRWTCSSRSSRRGYRFATLGEAPVPAVPPTPTGELWRGRALLWATRARTGSRPLLAGAPRRRRADARPAAAHGRVRTPARPHPTPAGVGTAGDGAGLDRRPGVQREGGHRGGDPLARRERPPGRGHRRRRRVDRRHRRTSSRRSAAAASRVIRQENAGKPAALNTGIRAARHDLIVMVDGDTVLRAGHRRHARAAVRRPGGRRGLGNAKVGNRRGLLGRWQHIEYVMGFNLDRRLYDVVECMPTVPGAIGAFRRPALARRRRRQRRHPRRGHRPHRWPSCRAGWRVVYEEDARAWTEAPATLGAAVEAALPLVLRHAAGDVEAPARGRRARRQRPVRPARPVCHDAVFQVLLPLTRAGDRRLPAVRPVLPRRRGRRWCWSGAASCGVQLADGGVRVPARPRVAAAAVDAAAAAVRVPPAHVPRRHPVRVHRGLRGAAAVGEAAPHGRRRAARGDR